MLLIRMVLEITTMHFVRFTRLWLKWSSETESNNRDVHSPDWTDQFRLWCTWNIGGTSTAWFFRCWPQDDPDLWVCNLYTQHPLFYKWSYWFFLENHLKQTNVWCYFPKISNLLGRRGGYFIYINIWFSQTILSFKSVSLLIGREYIFWSYRRGLSSCIHLHELWLRFW